MTTDEMLKVMEKCMECGVDSFVCSEFSFKFKKRNKNKTEPKFNFTLSTSTPAPVTQVPEVKSEELVKPLSPLDQMTDEEILFYHSPYFDEIQAKKAEYEKHLNESKHEKDNSST